MPHINPEDLERDYLRGFEAEARINDDPIAKYYSAIGRKMIYGPVDTEVTESQAIMELIVMQQVDGFSSGHEKALNKACTTIDGRPFNPQKNSVLDDRGVYSSIILAGMHEISIPGSDTIKPVYVEQCYLFAGAVNRMIKRWGSKEPLTIIRTRIFDEP